MATVPDRGTYAATTYRFSPDDNALMDALGTALGLPSRADVLRLALRRLARAEGVQVPTGAVEKKARKTGKTA